MILYVSFLFLKYGVKTGYIVLAPLLIFYYSIVLTDTYIKENSDAKKKKRGLFFCSSSGCLLDFIMNYISDSVTHVETFLNGVIQFT